MKKIIIVFLGLCCCMVSYGQQLYQIKIISVPDSLPLSNASVILESGVTTRTNAHGVFTIGLLDRGTNAVISHVGYVDRKVLLSPSDTVIGVLPVKMEIEEVLVSSGYEDLPLERVTGSFARIGQELLDRSASMDVISRLEDITPGIHFERGGTSFNSVGRRPDNNIFMHGISTIRGNATGANAPLIIVDNFPYEGDINNINPNDVESVTLLKDAAASSIWGARAGNGVIVITTKKAKYDQPMRINFNSSINISEKPDLFQHRIIDNTDFIDMEILLFEKGFYNSKETSRAKPALSPVVDLLIKQRDGVLSIEETKEMIDAHRNYDIRNDMLAYMYREAVQQQYSLSLDGGGAKNRFRVGLGFDRALPSQMGNQNSRTTLTLENAFKPLGNLEINLGLRWIGNQQYTTLLSESYSNNGYPFPYIRLADDNGSPLAIPKDYRMSFLDAAGETPLLDWHFRPLDEIKNPPRRNSANEMIGNVGLNYRIIPWLTVDLKYQYRRNNGHEREYFDLDSYYTRNLVNRGTELINGIAHYHFPYGGILTKFNTLQDDHSGRLQFSVNKLWGQDHQLHALIGSELSDRKNLQDGFTTYGYDDNLLTFASTVDHLTRYPVYGNLAAGETVPYPVLDLTATQNRFVSTFLNASYTYLGRYTASASARRDASNVFGLATNNKWTPLWSAGISWSLHKEKFLNAEWVSQLKIRTTYGLSGNVDNSMSAQPTIAYLNNSSGTLVTWPAAQIRNPPNPELRWEKVRNINIGLDFSLLQSKLSGSIDLYQKSTRDLLQSYPLDPTVGTASMVMNVANTRTKGIDLTINSKNIERRFKWTTHFLLSYNNNWITKSYTTYNGPAAYVQNGVLSTMENTLAFPVYSYAWAGLDPETGEARGYLNGEISKDYRSITSAQTTIDDLVFHGSSRPLLFGALRNDFTYGAFSLSANLSWRLRYYFRRTGMDYGRMINNSDGHVDYYNRWQKPGDEKFTHVPAFEYPISVGNTFYQYSEVLVEKGDHIRLRDVRFTYTMDKQEWKLKNVRLFVNVTNVGILWRANKLRLDPEVRGNIPLPRSYAIGLNLNI